MRNYFLIETAFTHRKFVFPPLEKNGQAHVAIATKTLCVISHFAKTFGHILFRPFCYVVQARRIAGFCFPFVSSIYENWSISTTKHMHSMVIYFRPGMSNLLIY